MKIENKSSKQENNRQTIIQMNKGYTESSNANSNTFPFKVNDESSNREEFNLFPTHSIANNNQNNNQNPNQNLSNLSCEYNLQQLPNTSQNSSYQNLKNKEGKNNLLSNQIMTTNFNQEFNTNQPDEFFEKNKNPIQNEKAIHLSFDYKKSLENFLHEDANVSYKISIDKINDINLNQRIINSIQYKIPKDYSNDKQLITDLNLDKYDYISKNITHITVDVSSFDIYHSIFKLAFICLMESELSIRAQASIKIKLILETESLSEYHYDFSYCLNLLNHNQVIINTNNLSIVCPLINYLYCKYVHDDLTQDLIFSHILSFVSNVFIVNIKLFVWDEGPVKMIDYTSKNHIGRNLSLIKFKDNLIMLYEGSINSVEKSTNTMKKEFSFESNVSKLCPINKSIINFSFF